MDKYYTPEQQATIRKRAETMGLEAIKKAETDWQELMAAVQKEMEAGTNPTEPRVIALAASWFALVSAFTGGDAGITQSVGKLWQEETTIHDIDTSKMRAMMAYIGMAGGGKG